MDKETSPHVSSIASRVLNLELLDLPAECQGCDAIRVLLRDAKTLAGSCMSQDETPGQEKPAGDFYSRLRNERAELDKRIAALQSFLSSEPGHVSSKQLTYLDSQLSAMKVYLSILDLRLDDLETGSVDSAIDAEIPENDHAE